MALSISGVSALNTSINQMQSKLQTQTQNESLLNQSSSSDSLELGQNESTFDTYTEKGNMSKAESNANLISNTLNKMNSNPFASSAQNDSYQFNKEVLGAYSKY